MFFLDAGNDRLLIGTATAIDAPFVQIAATKNYSNAIPRNMLSITDLNAYNSTDNGGAITFQGEYSGGSFTSFASVEGNKYNNTAGDYSGKMRLATRRSGGVNEPRLDLSLVEAVFNEDAKDCNFRVESSGNAHAFFVDAGDNNIMFGQAVASTITNGAYFSNALAAAGTHFHMGIAHTSVTAAHSVLYVNRQSSDGTLMEFRHANTPEGTISVSSATVSYNGFSGRHESSGIPANTPVGTVVSTIDALDVYPATQADPEGGVEPNPKAGQTRADHAQVEVSTSEGDSCVYGVVSEFDSNGKLIVTSVGIGSIRVTGACSKGDLLESNGDGTAKVQSDDIVRSKTLGKVTIGNSDTGVKLVACVMYCG